MEADTGRTLKVWKSQCVKMNDLLSSVNLRLTLAIVWREIPFVNELGFAHPGVKKFKLFEIYNMQLPKDPA